MSDDAPTQGLEELVAAAALDDQIATAMAAKDLDALEDLGVELSEVEQRIFLATATGLLQRLSGRVRDRLTQTSKRDFLSGAATAAGILAASGLGACASKPIQRVNAGVRRDPDPPPPPPARDAGTPRARPRPAPNPRDYPAPTGVRPDRPPKKIPR